MIIANRNKVGGGVQGCVPRKDPKILKKILKITDLLGTIYKSCNQRRGGGVDNFLSKGEGEESNLKADNLSWVQGFTL